ncbi:MFS transporter [Streptomyces sp. ME02-6987-2C]|uniref:MFS transporter n=1 Tax=unclassified Streptomyces TaxID=2593676 RepID=UPI00087AA3DC|nr:MULTISPECIES: MFS transporter [unclassified Streptomyces]MDX3368039.1 MFS transporter [Streptomyces sp. ME02-6987-2C]MDX3406241.1 MFS transporter [Streptomyces sp. ME02-6977A]MDX3420353.1 MFS transporter [Streptomyces sp. ME02-6985-2c]REH19852.1 DHA2 family multidrug resistance protein-like MFS transporter [Streptomyces sp. 2221.1]SDS99685.1 MFS transporter, DHA2 family, multidrug resistance protein [Streptomyces sp. 2114.2]
MNRTLQPAHPTEAVKRPGRWLALSVLVLAVLLVAVDATVLGLATPYISEDLAPSGTQLLWIGDVYSFVIAGLLVSMGSLGDRIGRKRILLIGATAFGAISVLNAYAHTPEVMIFARALLGVAGATLMPATLALIRNLFHDPRERSLAVGIWGAAASAGAAVGPVVGGFLLEHFWWGSVFLINLPVMVVLVVVGVKMLPESRNPNPGPWDLLSVVLSLVGMVGVVYAVKETAAHGFAWATLAAGLLGAAALYGFVRRQLTMPVPLLDMRLFRNRGFSGAVLADLLTILGLSGLVFFLSQYLQLVQGRRPFEAGLAELPAAVGAVVAGLIAGRAARRFSVRAVVAGGLAAVGLALAALTVIGQHTGYPLLGAALLVVGLGAGFAFTVTADVILSSVPGEQAGAASAVSETAYELGAALGIAVLGSIVTGVYRDFTGPAGTPDAAHESLGGAVEAAAHLPGSAGEALLDSARQAFVDGLTLAAGVGAAVLLAAAAASWYLLRGQRLEDGVEHP